MVESQLIHRTLTKYTPKSTLIVSAWQQNDREISVFHCTKYKLLNEYTCDWNWIVCFVADFSHILQGYFTDIRQLEWGYLTIVPVAVK